MASYKVPNANQVGGVRPKDCSPFPLRRAASRSDQLLFWPTLLAAVNPIRTLLVLDERGLCHGSTRARVWQRKNAFLSTDYDHAFSELSSLHLDFTEKYTSHSFPTVGPWRGLTLMN